MTNLIVAGLSLALMTPVSFPGMSPTDPSPATHGSPTSEFLGQTQPKQSTQIALGYYDRDGIWHWSDGSVDACWNATSGRIC